MAQPAKRSVELGRRLDATVAAPRGTQRTMDDHAADRGGSYIAPDIRPVAHVSQHTLGDDPSFEGTKAGTVSTQFGTVERNAACARGRSPSF